MTEKQFNCEYCKKGMSCEIGQICTLTKENLIERNFEICEYFESDCDD